MMTFYLLVSSVHITLLSSIRLHYIGIAVRIRVWFFYWGVGLKGTDIEV